MSYFSKVAIALVCVFFIFSCQTIKQPDEIFTPPDYTEQDVINAEKKRIRQIAKTNPVESLWRAIIINDEETIAECVQLVAENLEQELKDEKYLDAKRLHRSLITAGFAEKATAIIDTDELDNHVFSDIPGLNKVAEEFLPHTIADCINATATIWVDRGIRVERGAGFSDIVIGSGFFIDERGYLVTNHHVIADLVDPTYEGFARLYVRLPTDSDTRIPAKVIGYDSALDLALLKVEITPPYVLRLGSSSDLSVGDRVSAIGTPLGLEGTLTQGIVSSTDRKLFMMGNVFQIDAAINSGNSGGPLIDANMRVQAIVFAGILDYQGLNFAIPVEYLRQNLPYLFRGGERKHSWTGSYGHTVKLANGRENGGLELQYKMPGGSTSRAKIPDGAIIKSVDGQSVNSIEDMQNILRTLEPKTLISCTYTYDKDDSHAEKTQLLYLDERPENPGYAVFSNDLINTSFVPIYGMQLSPSSTTSKKQYMITNIINGGIADESGFSVNDPVYVNSVKFNNDKSHIYAEISTRRSKRGFLDIMIGLAASLNSPFYF